jgi:hypothetical protein
VLVSVTTAVPLQAASASNASPMDAASSRLSAPRVTEKGLEQDIFIGWAEPPGGAIVQRFPAQLKPQIGKDL